MIQGKLIEKKSFAEIHIKSPNKTSRNQITKAEIKMPNIKVNVSKILIC